MDEDLRNYRLQLQQVEAALTTDPENEELIKLKADLQEVIELTQDLLKNQQTEETAKVVNGAIPVDDDVTASLMGAELEVGSNNRAKSKKKWKIGDKCLAKWEDDGQFYEATIDEIIDSTARVLFADYNQYEICHLDHLKDSPTGVKRSADDSGDEKHGKIHNRDYLKKKKQKKQQRYKQIEEERESEKNKWLSFNAKSTKKSGAKGKSIFASPDNVNGRVGIGTCGISGKPMTEFSHGEMWRKGT
ncbi:survival of motor neuron-related-splicing factor 30 [Arctopsyche grandis]|uniref:survival of motor neuron-related-splicing factor 30 n=1 Tax=Arctopsyche grandis TaxID=121162 RepID=UPI00406D8162